MLHAHILRHNFRCQTLVIYLRVVLRVYYYSAAPGEIFCLVREVATSFDIC